MTKSATVTKGKKSAVKKTCTKCGVEKSETDFALTKIRGRMVRRSWCNPCMSEYYKAYSASKAKIKPKG